jgi:adenylate cyclase
MQLRDARRFARAWTIVAGCLLAVAVGFACQNQFAEPLKRTSYDLPFLLRTTLDTHEIALVYLDEESAKQLHQPIDGMWNRALHIPLLERLTRDGARLVFYDFVFDTPSADPTTDAALGAALQGFGKAILGGAIEVAHQMGEVQERIIRPLPLLRKASAGWGILAFRPLETDYAVRQLFPGTTDFPSATWKAAEVLGAPSTREPREAPVQRWINYYGPKNTFASVSFARALDPEGVPPGFFKNKIVMVGGRSAIGYQASGRDEFATPYTRRGETEFTPGHQLTPGLEVQATILLNLLRGEWLTRIPEKGEGAIIILVGLIAGALAALRPSLAVTSALILSCAIACLACWLVWHRHIWFNWMAPAVIQIPIGLAWSVGCQYLLESRRRKELRRAFGFYLSPQMADRIANSNFDLKPGGKMVDATIIFTDLENFTTLSEHLDPEEVSEILTSYFGQTTKCILEDKGTIIKYVGDAVMAAWGAPIDDPHHAIHAVDTACDLRSLSELVVRGKTLRTRVGIHSGRVLAGNLGSTYRFDYTMIGDAVNLASRLESLNKYLRTQVLISDAVRRQIGDGYITREVGEFRVAGKTQSVVIHELLGRRDEESGEKNWIANFEKGLRAFRAGEFATARDDMERTREMRGGSDGPSEFYVKKIATLEANIFSPEEEWTGVIELSEK